MDILTQAAQVIAGAQGGSLVYSVHLRDRRVARAQLTPFRRADVGCWIARLTGLDRHYGFAREFLPQAYPLVFQKKFQPAFDFTDVGPGEILQFHGHISHGNTEDQFYRVVSNDDVQVVLEKMTLEQVVELFRQ
jgi:hypothetical protein